MKGIIISNVKTEGLKPMDYYNNQQYKMFGIHDGSSTLVPMYINFLREVIDRDVYTVFKDRALSTTETTQIKTIFERELDELCLTFIPLKKDGMPPNDMIEYKDKKYEVRDSLNFPIHRRMLDYFSIINLCKECLDEDKPMYLGIE